MGAHFDSRLSKPVSLDNISLRPMILARHVMGAPLLLVELEFGYSGMRQGQMDRDSPYFFIPG